MGTVQWEVHSAIKEALTSDLASPETPAERSFITDLPEYSGNTTILVIVDLFFYMCHLVPLPHLPNAMELAVYIAAGVPSVWDSGGHRL
jgi:hypothetical protein